MQTTVDHAGALGTNLKGDLYVDASGKDGAYKTISAAVAAAKPGQTIVVAPGDYHEQIDINKSVTLLGETGATIDGAGLKHWIMGQHASDVTIKGFKFTNCDSPDYQGGIQIDNGKNWTIEGNDISGAHGAGVGASSSSDIKVIGNHLHDNGQEGFMFGRVTNLDIEENEVDHNNTRHFDTSAEAGAGKFSNCDNSTFANNIVHDNIGNGIWGDINDNNSLLYHNWSYGNTQSGIVYEISHNAKILDNAVWDNGTQMKGLKQGIGAGIYVNESSDTLVQGNTLVNNGNGISVLQSNRGPQWNNVHGDHIIGNTVIGGPDSVHGIGFYSMLDGSIFQSRSDNYGKDNRFYG
ncbi:MAG: right-handed parallel beta-helix repeat-containing protein, partial [Terriglobales bacterium]